MSSEKPGVGVALILMKEASQEVLLGGGLCRHGGGDWGFPGGKLEFGERAFHRSLKELGEETGLTRGNIEVIDQYPIEVTEDIFDEGLHFITLYFRARYLNGEPRIMEPDHCRAWEWYKWNRLPNRLFLPVSNLIKLRYDPFN